MRTPVIYNIRRSIVCHMIYEKRLLVLAGEENGCLRLERTSSALACRLTGNVRGDCVLAITAGGKLYTFGRFTLSSAYSFTLPPDIELDTFVAAVGDMHGRCIMSGGFKRPMPWQSNMEDWLRRAVRACGGNPDGEVAPEEKRSIDDYFLDIVPQEYDDGKIAEVNYYRSNLTSSLPESHTMQSSGSGEMRSREQQHIVNPQESGEVHPAQPLTSFDITGNSVQHTAGHGGKDPFPPQQMHASERTIRPIHTDGHEKLVRPVRSDEQEMRQSHAGASGTAEQTAAPADGQAGEAAASVTDGLPLSDADYGARKVPELGRATFYESVSDQLQKLFDKCERYTALEKLLPDSRWVKVDYDTSGRYYLVGLIGDPVRYMCYGVPGEYSPEPPPELAGYCQWLAVDPNDPAGKGFWIMYQDGVTGKSIL